MTPDRASCWHSREAIDDGPPRHSLMILALLVFLTCACKAPSQIEDAAAAFQNDADLARLEHLEYWTGLIEEYESKTGRFPFADKFSEPESIGLVRIATFEQAKFFDPESSRYKSQLDNNFDDRFHEFAMTDFVEELERGLGRAVDEKYDIQYVPTGSPVWYNYFVTDSGYLFWVTCITCGVTHISTLLFDGVTPTINITSEGMKDSVTKALTRAEMLAHPTFIRWKSKSFLKESFVRQREELHFNDSKKKPQTKVM